MKIEEKIEYGGFVKNEKTGKYELLARTDNKYATYHRALEEARRYNTYSVSLNFDGKYNLDDIVVCERKMQITYDAWERATYSPEEKKEPILDAEFDLEEKEPDF